MSSSFIRKDNVFVTQRQDIFLLAAAFPPLHADMYALKHSVTENAVMLSFCLFISPYFGGTCKIKIVLP